MTKTIHFVYISSMVITTLLVMLYLAFHGYEYYNLPIEERFYHGEHHFYKPSGSYGHGLGIIGTLMILFGVSIYIARKRYNFLARYIRLKYLLEFHIFLCTLGPILILFHTAFKFGGIVSIAFWSMVAVVASGVIGRFIYIQIPRTIEGQELSQGELQQIRNNLTESISNNIAMDNQALQFVKEITQKEKSEPSYNFISQFIEDRKKLSNLRSNLKKQGVPADQIGQVISLAKKELNLGHKIARLNKMQQLFKYWHVAHLPFALIMLIIVVIHVGITLAFGYKWIF